MKKISIKTFYLIAVISIGLIGLAVGSTYAMFTTSAEINNPITISSNLTSNNDVMETFEVEIEPYKTVTQTININSGTVSNVNYAVWYLNNISNVDIGILSTNTRTTGVIKDAGSGTGCNIVLRNNSAEKKTITIGVATSKSSISLASNMTIVPQVVIGERQINTNAATYIKELYSTTQKSTVTNNSITYNTSPSQLLMNDRKGSSSTGIDAGNIRYYGANPDNYVYFNCSNYNNPTASTCEVWRIIGVFDGKVKIMRSESIGAYSWDTTDSTTNGGDGLNDWTTSKLMMLLNSGYTYMINNLRRPASLYWNRTSGSCYNARNLAATSCSFTSTGLKNDTTKNMISETAYNLGAGTTSVGIYANQLYAKERGTTVYTGRPTTWTGKVVVPYASDYSYAVDFNKCSSTLYNYNNSTCTSNSWMYNIMTKSGTKRAWTLTPQSNGNADSVFGIYDNGGVAYGQGTRDGTNIVPTLYLNPDTIITTGEGTKDSPYKIKYEDSVKGEYFNGATNYKTLGFTNYNSATISLVARFKIESYNSGVAYIFGNPEGAGSGLALVHGKPTYEVFYSSNSSWTSVTALNRVSLNKWHTLVGTYESGTQKLYLDGTLVASTSSGVGTLVKTSTAPFTIGANPTVRGVEDSYFNGYISDVLAINSSLTSSVVSSYYGSNFNRSYNNANTLFKYTTEGSSYKLKGYNLGYASDGIQLQLDGKNNRGYSRSSSVKTWYDLSNNQNNGTITGTTWGSNYLSFASSSDHVEKTSATYNISSAYTIEIVLRPINQISTYQMIFSTVNTGTGVKQYMSLWSNQANSTYSNASYRIENADGTNHKNSYYAGIEKNTAYTLTAALNGTNIKIYKNGSLVNSETLTFTPRMSESGMYISSSSYPFYGYIYSIRVYNRELSAGEISANYQNDKSRFGF